MAGWWIVRQMREEVAVFVVDRGRIDEWVERRGVTRLPEVVEITMPATARLAPITAEVGQTVRKGDVVARLVRKDIDLALARAQHAAEELEARVDVLTQEALRISEGSRVELEVDGGRPESVFHWKGHVARIDPEGFTKVSSLGIEQQRVWITIRFDPETRKELLSRKMGAGYRVRARILTGSRNKVLRIPRTALFRSEAGRWEVWLARSGKLQRSAVEIGLANDRWAEVRKGLSAGDQVIVAPHTRLVTGQRVVTRVIKPSRLDPHSREP